MRRNDSEQNRRDDPGRPGGGAGRRDEVGRSGVFPASAGNAPEGAEIRTMAEWGHAEHEFGATEEGAAEEQRKAASPPGEEFSEQDIARDESD